jgi:hypothetical protein
MFIVLTANRAGKGLWRYKTLLPILASPAIDKGIIFAASEDGNVYSIK